MCYPGYSSALMICATPCASLRGVWHVSMEQSSPLLLTHLSTTHRHIYRLHPTTHTSRTQASSSSTPSLSSPPLTTLWLPAVDMQTSSFLGSVATTLLRLISSQVRTRVHAYVRECVHVCVSVMCKMHVVVCVCLLARVHHFWLHCLPLPQTCAARISVHPGFDQSTSS